jgi:type II secretory pathway pseudopilin PulG
MRGLERAPKVGWRHFGAAGLKREAKATNGYTILEVIVVIAILMIVLAAAIPRTKAYIQESSVRGAAFYIRSLLRGARSRAAAEARYIGVVFEEVKGDPVFSLYADGNGNGIRRADIRRGIDRRFREPYRLSAVFPGVHYGSLPDGAGPPFPGLRIGRSYILSFSPLGSSTSGTVFLSNEYGQVYAVIVMGSTGKVRIARYRGGRWQAV